MLQNLPLLSAQQSTGTPTTATSAAISHILPWSGQWSLLRGHKTPGVLLAKARPDCLALPGELSAPVAQRLARGRLQSRTQIPGGVLL